MERQNRRGSTPTVFLICLVHPSNPTPVGSLAMVGSTASPASEPGAVICDHGP